MSGTNENDLQGRVGLDIRDFKSGVAELNREIKVIETGFKAAAAGSEDWSQDAGLLGERIDSLTKIMDLQRQKVEETRKAYEAIKAEKGENSRAAQELAIRLNNETAALNRTELNINDLTHALDSMGNETRTAEQKAKGLSDAMDDLGKKSQTGANIVKGALTAVAAGTAAAGAALIAFGKDGLGLASDLNEVQNVVDVTFGKDGAKTIEEWSTSAATAFGIGELQAKKFNGTMGAMLKSMKLSDKEVLTMSTGLSGLAGDFASFYNLDPQEAFDKLRSGISGETEPLKQLGINMSVANLEAFALSQGITKTFSAMSQAEQATLRYNFLMAASADAQGDYARTSDGYANKQRELGLVIDNLAGSFGEKLLPAANEAITQLIEGISTIDPAVFDGLVESVTDLAVNLAESAVDSIPKVIDFLSFLMTNGNTIMAIIIGIGTGMVAWNVVTMVQALVGVIKAWSIATEGLSIAQKLLNLVLAANPIGIVITAVSALVAGIIYLWNTNEDFRNFVIAAWENIKTVILSMANAVMEKVTEWAQVGTAIVEGLNLAYEDVKKTVSNWVDIGKNIVLGIVQGIKDWAYKIVDSVKSIVSNAISSAKSALGIQSPSRVFRDQVGAMIGEGMALGIEDSSDVVNAAMKQLSSGLSAEGNVNIKSKAIGLNGQTISQGMEQAVGKSIIMNVTLNVRSAAEAMRELDILKKQLASAV